MIIHSPVDERLGCFPLFGVTNKASGNIVYLYFCGTKCPFFLGKYLEVERLGHMEDRSSIV